MPHQLRGGVSVNGGAGVEMQIDLSRKFWETTKMTGGRGRWSRQDSLS
jgi:hypothetical protein